MPALRPKFLNSCHTQLSKIRPDSQSYKNPVHRLCGGEIAQKTVMSQPSAPKTEVVTKVETCHDLLCNPFNDAIQGYP